MNNQKKMLVLEIINIVTTGYLGSLHNLLSVLVWVIMEQ